MFNSKSVICYLYYQIDGSLVKLNYTLFSSEILYYTFDFFKVNIGKS